MPAKAQPRWSLELFGEPIVCGPNVHDRDGKVFSFLQMVPTPDGRQTLIGRFTKNGRKIAELEKVDPDLTGYCAFWVFPSGALYFRKWNSAGVDLFEMIEREYADADIWKQITWAAYQAAEQDQSLRG